MKIYLLDINKEMTDAWSKYFDIPNVYIINEEFTVFMNDHPNIDAIVSPANSFGLMDGGYDKAITDYFGDSLMKNVQKVIMEEWNGEQPVGTSISVPIRMINTENTSFNQILIHTPTMIAPERIIDFRIIYQCMRTTLIEALKNSVETIVIPAFGGATGRVPFDIIAKMMFLGYNQVLNGPKEINWSIAYHTAKKLRNITI